MTPELTALALAGLLQGLQFCAYSVAATRQLGPRATMGPRDTPLVPAGVVGRMQRALNNHFEGLILFTLAVLVVTLGNQSNALTAACAWLYLAARILYIPAYLLGWVPGRSMIWAAGFGATMVMLLAALF
ncbi:MAPEG family protein [Paracoccus marinaquae]|uniref:MAPEG family protein n=1 Tax=Paracoccus marinaquae TaxID=2841926 RepID=A0ABS6AH79_9RHOB|nr:MAPEG family protein [Paracoccus marinaquae]MBU3029940.1 MAPEG family protein [Paracoccus marinaquae]